MTPEQLQKLEAAEKIFHTHLVGGQKIKTVASFRKQVIEQQGPVIALFKRPNDETCQKVERRLKRGLIRTKGQFKLCLIDADVIDTQLQSAFNIHFTPSIFLFYKQNVAQEYRGNPSREQVNDFIRAAQFFHQMTNEEQLILELLKEGQKSVESKNWSEAAHYFNEADGLDKWRDIYGGKIYSNLGK